MPWPIPFSVISSAIHIISPVPPVITSTIKIREKMELFGSVGRA
jgi:hypothetical protein